MLAKIWKKLLLAVCIIACLFNVTSKLVNRKSLQTNLDSIKNGISFSDLLKSFEQKFNANSENEYENEELDENSSIISNNAKQNETNTNSEYIIVY